MSQVTERVNREHSKTRTRPPLSVLNNVMLVALLGEHPANVAARTSPAPTAAARTHRRPSSPAWGHRRPGRRTTRALIPPSSWRLA